MRTSATVIALVVGLLLFANGAWMLLAPLGWFTATPIVWRTGAANAHFIRDVGWTYGAVGGLLIWGLVDRNARKLSLIVAATWLGGHAAIHAAEAATGICSSRQFASETPQVLGPVMLLLIALGLDGADRRRLSK